MSQPMNDETGAPGPPRLNSNQKLLIALGGAAVLALIIGFAVWISAGDETLTSSTVATSSPTTSAAPTTVSATSSPTTEPPATTAPTTEPATTLPTTTLPPTTAPEPTSPPTTLPTQPSGDSWTVTSSQFPEHPFTLTRVAQTDPLAAYDGAIDVDPNGMRCVAIVKAGTDGWSEWCGEPGQSATFVLVNGIDPWVVEVGAEPGDVTLNRRDPSWVLPTNGCNDPMTNLLAAAPGGGSIGSAVTTGIVCVPGEAFVAFGSGLLQPGLADGGGALLTNGDEGWDSLGAGTSFDCEAGSDGVDRCALYGVEFELFEAVLPIPPNAALTETTDLLAVGDVTATASGWIGDAELSPEAVDALIVGEVTDPDAEVAPTITRAPGSGWGTLGSGSGTRLNLLVIEVPAMDDSILSTTFAAWITTETPASVARMYSWQTCARGLADPDTCI